MNIAGSTASRRSARYCRSRRLLPGRRIAQQFCREGTWHHHQAVKRDPAKASLRARRDAELRSKIKTCWEASGKRYGAVKVWYDLVAEGEDIARCTVVRLMKEMGIQGVIRGKGKKTTHDDPALPCPEDKVNRDFKAPAPNILWVADFTYVHTAVGFVSFGPCPRTVYGWPLGKSFVRSSGIWSVAAMYTASRLRHEVPRALMKSAGVDGSRSMARRLRRTGPNWVSRLFYLRLVPSPAPFRDHASHDPVGQWAGHCRRQCPERSLTLRLTVSGPPGAPGGDLFVSQPGAVR
ncbi:IS3 family transposase [Jannaschia sp.]|nr:IS3 family transposase [Jannaschia sp.]